MAEFLLQLVGNFLKNYWAKWRANQHTYHIKAHLNNSVKEVRHVSLVRGRVQAISYENQLEVPKMLMKNRRFDPYFQINVYHKR